MKSQSLQHACAGRTLSVAGFAAHTPAETRERLLAYGLVPGQILRVLAVRPLLIVQVEHTELALERQLAAAVQVQAAP